MAFRRPLRTTCRRSSQQATYKHNVWAQVCNYCYPPTPRLSHPTGTHSSRIVDSSPSFLSAHFIPVDGCPVHVVFSACTHTPCPVSSPPSISKMVRKSQHPCLPRTNLVSWSIIEIHDIEQLLQPFILAIPLFDFVAGPSKMSVAMTNQSLLLWKTYGPSWRQRHLSDPYSRVHIINQEPPGSGLPHSAPE